MEFPEVEYDKIYREVKGRAHHEGAYTLDAWKTIVDDIVEGHEEFGEIREEGEQNLKDILIDRFEEFRSEIPEA